MEQEVMQQRVYTLSPSSLSLLDECGRCFWLSVNEGVKRPSGKFPSLPSGMDGALKRHFDVYRGSGELPSMLSALNGRAELFGDHALLKRWRSNTVGIRWADEKGNTLYGAIDELLQEGDELAVLDFKTRGFALKDDTAAHYQDQMNIYHFLLQQNGFRTADHAYLLFLHTPKMWGDRDAEFAASLVPMAVDTGAAERLFRRGLETLAGQIPASSPTCEYCSWAERAAAYR